MSATEHGAVVVGSPDELSDAVGRTAVGEWFTIDQSRIDLFADATEDHQWIHVDPERAASGPFGATIAHGFLTLSMLPHLAASLLRVEKGVGMVVNYGLDRVRFLTPVTVGSRVRARTEIRSSEASDRGVRVTSTVTIEIEGADKPALVAQSIGLYVPAS